MPLNRLLSQPPPLLAVWALLISLAIFLSRGASQTEALPAFSSFSENLVAVELSSADMTSKVHQFNDGFTPLDVIKLTDGESLLPPTITQDWSKPLIPGEKLIIIKKGRKIESLRREWMSSSHRVVMGIALHPDHMSAADWLFLPGVGVALAERIENDRQKNGEFGSLEGLLRVKGVGEKRIISWRKFFDDA